MKSNMYQKSETKSVLQIEADKTITIEFLNKSSMQSRERDVLLSIIQDAGILEGSPGNNIYLDEEDIKSLAEDMSRTGRKEPIYSAFIIACLTGMKYYQIRLLKKGDPKVNCLKKSKVFFQENYPTKMDWHYLIENNLKKNPTFFQRLPYSVKNTKEKLLGWVKHPNMQLPPEKMDWEVARLSYFRNLFVQEKINISQLSRLIKFSTYKITSV